MKRTDDDLEPELDLDEDSGDDEVIGRALRASLIAIVALAALGAGAWVLLRDRGAPEVVRDKQLGEVAGIEADAASMPAVRFVDVAREAGIDFVHVSGAAGEKLLPETMGGGVAFIDFDADGDEDLLFVNGRPWRDGGDTPMLALYRNDGSGRFADATAAAGLDGARGYGMGAAVADVDADGDPDLYVTALGANVMYRNDDGRFVDVTRRAGVAGDDDEWSASAGFVDHDGDGDLDLFVTTYVRWSREIDIELAFSLNGTDRAYGPPTNYEGAHSVLYRNDGGWRFSDVSAEAGIRVDNPSTGRPMGKALGVSFADLDRDGHTDIVVANDTVQNFVFRNLGDGSFEEIGATSGLGFDGAGKATGAMGIDVAHHRNDAEIAVAIGNFANEMTSLYVAQRGLQFTDESIGEGIGAPSRIALSFGLFFFDYDLDGRLDLLQANGHLESEISQVQASQRYRQPAQLFWNAGPEARSCFAEVPGDGVGDLSRPIVGRGAAWADIDADGDLDVVLTQIDGPPLVLRNEQATGHPWLQVRLLDRTGANRDGIGGWVELDAGGLTQRRAIAPTRSYLSQVPPIAAFGLDGLGPIDALRVVWPDGEVQAVPGPIEPGRVLTVTR